MNRLLSSKSGTLTLLGFFALALAGCGDTACEELGEVCPQCRDNTYRESCLQLVQDEIDDVCDAQMSTFQNACPAPE